MGVPPGRGGPFDSRWLSLVDLLANPGFFQVRLMGCCGRLPESEEVVPE